MQTRPSLSQRLLVALAVGAAIASITWAGHSPPDHRTDFDYLWYAGRAVASGENPYVTVDSVIAARRLRFPLMYPGPGVLIAAPYGVLDRRLALALWNGTAFGLLALGLSAAGWWRLWAILSAPCLYALDAVQFSPLLAAGVAMPWLAGLWAAKPTIGLALFAGWPSRRAVIAGATLTVASILLVPGWVPAWLHNVAVAPHAAPVTRPLGVILLAAWLRWREPEARMLGALALIPQITVPYEAVYLLLIPRTPRELAIMLACGWAALFGIWRYTIITPADIPNILRQQWPWMLAGFYLPALAIVLARVRDRSIVGTVRLP